MRTTKFVIVVVACLGFGAAAMTQPGAGVAEVRALLSSHLPHVGAVEAVFTPMDRGAAEVNVGFDASTGAWYLASNTGATLRLPSGALLSGEPRIGGLVPSSAFPKFTADVGLIDQIPTCFLSGIAQGHVPIDTVERLSTGGFSFAVVLGQIVPGSPSVFCEIDAEGVLRKTWRNDPKDRREHSFEYSEKSPPGFPIPSRIGGLGIATITFHPQGDAELFVKGRVESLAAQSRVNVAKTLAAMAQAGLDASANGAGGVSVPAPRQPSAFAEYRWPLVMLGLILVVVGIVYRIRGRH